MWILVLPISPILIPRKLLRQLLRMPHPWRLILRHHNLLILNPFQIRQSQISQLFRPHQRQILFHPQIPRIPNLLCLPHLPKISGDQRDLPNNRRFYRAFMLRRPSLQGLHHPLQRIVSPTKVQSIVFLMSCHMISFLVTTRPSPFNSQHRENPLVFHRL